MELEKTLRFFLSAYILSLKHPAPHDVKTLSGNKQEEVLEEINQIGLGNPDGQGNLRELFTKWRTPLLISTSLAAFQQLTGHSNVLNYTADIFHLSGFKGGAPVVVLGIVKVIATAVAIVWVSGKWLVLRKYTS